MGISQVCSSTFVQVKVWIAVVCIDFRPVRTYYHCFQTKLRQRLGMTGDGNHFNLDEGLRGYKLACVPVHTCMH